MTATRTKRAAEAPEQPFAEVDAPLAEAEKRVAALSHQVHVALPAEQRKIQAEMDAAQRSRDNAGFVAARAALDAAKRKRNGVIDELEAAKGAAVIAKRDADHARRTTRRVEMLAKAEAIAAATSAELLEEQRQLPARLMAAARDVDVDLVRELRRRQVELPDLIYAARVVETAKSIEAVKQQAAAAAADAAALAPELEAAEERLRKAKEERDRLVDEVRFRTADAELAAQEVKQRERTLDALAAEAFKREAPVVRSLIGWNPGAA